MREIADGEISDYLIYLFTVFRDGEYVSQVEASNTVVQSVHTFSIIGKHEEGDLSRQLAGYRENGHLAEYYESQGVGEIGLELFHFKSDPGPLYEQKWIGSADDGSEVMIRCAPQSIRVGGGQDRRQEYGLCGLIFMAEPRVRVVLNLPHFQLDQWRTHRTETLELLNTWKVN